jgi:hypothetical protein
METWTPFLTEVKAATSRHVQGSGIMAFSSEIRLDATTARCFRGTIITLAATGRNVLAATDS